MATLVLSTAGTVLGGPVGSAIGALIGQSIDQELLAPVRRGPRLGDLAVQTSTYGAQLPRIYGTMRVAGSVIWATDLVEAADPGGAKGAPDVTYSYSVSLAVALSSRPVKEIGRIWADGKLLRGDDGEFKIGTIFRFHDGSEDQELDPLIASAEGIASSPAYRGIALAVFENLELAEFGNRIPFLTFEVNADDAPPALGWVLSDASDGVISTAAEQGIAGFAAYGHSRKSAVEPLVESFGLKLFDDGSVLRSAPEEIVPIGEDEFGNNFGEPASRLKREQAPARSAPAVLRVGYYEAARDYQAGEARAVASERAGSEVQHELPVVLSAGEAKSLAQQMLARAWAARDRLTLRLPLRRLSLKPGARVQLPVEPPHWTIESMTIEAFVMVAQLRPWIGDAVSVSADGGRIAPNPDVRSGPVTLALLDIPNLVSASDTPVVLVAASSPTAGWKRRPVELGFGGQQLAVETARVKSVIGQSLAALMPGSTELIDEVNSIEVQLVDADQWLTSCDDDALASGQNMAVIGSELFQFGRAVPLGEGRFRLGRLLRGRGGTEWACGSHEAGEQFCILQAGSLQSVALPSWCVGSTVAATSAGSTADLDYRGESLRPPTPVNLAAENTGNGDLLLSWTRRSRRGFAWIDDIDAPLGEAREQYEVTLAGAEQSLEMTTDQPSLTIGASALATLGSGAATVDVRQMGDAGASRAVQIGIIL